MTTYLMEHTFTTTRCDDCGMTFTKALLTGEDCKPGMSLEPSITLMTPKEERVLR